MYFSTYRSPPTSVSCVVLCKSSMEVKCLNMPIYIYPHAYTYYIPWPRVLRCTGLPWCLGEAFLLDPAPQCRSLHLWPFWLYNATAPVQGKESHTVTTINISGSYYLIENSIKFLPCGQSGFIMSLHFLARHGTLLVVTQ